jgi:uroporphyrinogen III methyltransferase/synthase
MREGVVALVGAGPGDPGLLTLRGRWWLRRADVVIYDRLVDPRLLDEAPRWALRVFAGKGHGCHGLPQPDINTLLIAHARRGRRVVRLKGGDPFVFGRGGEEAEALTAASIRVEIVPGVSSALAVPAAAGIPVTDRRFASSFAVLTGHEVTDRPTPRVDWRRLATAADTLVILMGLARLRRIAGRLIDHGRSPATPAAVIAQGTTPAQRVVVGTLRDIADRAEAAALTPPAVIVVGEVVGLRDRVRGAGPEGANRRKPRQRARLVGRRRRRGDAAVTSAAVRSV